MRRTKEQAALTREGILDAALQVFLKKGFAATTLEDISKAAGVTRGALYWHFKGKLDVYEQLYRRESQSNDGIRTILTEDIPPFVCVRKLMSAVLRRFYTNERFRQYVEMTSLKIESGVGTDALNKDKAKVYDEIIWAIAEKLEAAKKDGSILPSIHPLLAARFLMTFIIGSYRLYFTAPEHFQNFEESQKMLEGYLDLMVGEVNESY